jgi:RimJ/RimL family protein N-acetyltransferase
MHIIESSNIDLIEPFPITEAKRAFTWLHCYKNIVESDLSPKSAEEFEQFLGALLPYARSFGVIDKFNKLNTKHEAPLVGMIIFEPSTIWNCFVHIASPRRAWGSGFIDEGITAAVGEIFSTEPSLTRVSAYVLENNAPVKGLARRLGFRFEGCFHDMVTQNNEPRNILLFGMTKKDWQARQAPEQDAAVPPAVAA